MERLSWESINELKKKPQLKITVLAHHGSRSTSPLFAFTVIPRALRAARQADVVHLGDPMLSLVGWLIKKIRHKPVAVTVHGLDITYGNPLYRLYLKLFFRQLDLYLPISQHVDQLLGQHNVTGQHSVINPGIHDRHYSPDIANHDLARLLKRNITGCTVLLTSGRLVRRKGHAWFIKNILPKLDPNTLYIIAGQGPEANNIKEVITQGKMSERVFTLGRVSESDLKILYNTIDAFVQPNIKIADDVEGFGLVLLEAVLCNRPVFAADIDGIPDAIKNGENGYLITSGNTQAWIKTLSTIKPLPHARTYTLSHFSWNSAASKYSQALLSLAGRHTTVRNS